MIECCICHEEYQKDDLELHREMCVVRLMFRCSLCNGDYVSKEGLWNHLDLHEIVDESKELHYLEIKAKHKLHQCVLCNDQRAYEESLFWKHVHDVHDGFFLRCSDCGENFRSEEFKNAHVSSYCKARIQVDEPVPREDGNLKLLREEYSTSRLSEHPQVNLNTANNVDNNSIDKVSELPTIISTKGKDMPLFACDACGQSFSFIRLLRRHKSAKYSCSKGKQQKCPHCRKVIIMNQYQAHFKLCEKKKFPCKLCPSKFNASVNLEKHWKSVHLRKRVPKDEKQAQNNVAKTLNLSGKTSSDSDSSSNSNVVQDTGISTAKKTVEHPSSDTKCSHCDKECGRISILRVHTRQCHRPTMCNICGVKLEGASRVRYHKLMKHSKPKYECANPSKNFHRVKLYKRQSNICDPIHSDLSTHKDSDEIIPKERSDPKVTAENSSSEQSLTTCSHCGLEESSSDTLARLMHHDPVACDLCGITFPSLCQAQHHKKTKHKETKMKCPHCTMQFPGRQRLEKHISRCKKQKVPCDLCGAMFKNSTAVNKHSSVCPANKTTKEQELKSTEMRQCDKTGSSTTVMEKIAPPLVESGLSQTQCSFCNEESSSPGYLILHLKICHELTKCNICGITILGLSVNKYHKVKCHEEPKHECPTCGAKFHCKKKYNLHCFQCEHKMYLCTLCGAKFRRFKSVKRHNKQYHPNKTDNIQIVQDHKQVQTNDLLMEITAEETTKSARDYQRKSTVNISENVGVSSTLSNEHSSSRFDDNDSMVSQGIDEESPVVSDAPSMLSNNPYVCSICGCISRSYSQLNYHKLTNHTEQKFQCTDCSRKFYFKQSFERHLSCCAGLKYSCDLCGLKFNIKSKVVNHKKRVHRVNRSLRNADPEGAESTELMKHKVTKLRKPKYECAKCSEKFHFIRHYERHSNECDSLLNDLSSQKKSDEFILEEKSDPKVVAENSSNEASCKCSYCGINESSAVTLTRHVLMNHDPVACDFCGITLSSFSKAQHHMKTLHNEAKHKCPHCSMHCFARGKLLNHLSKCNDEKVPCDFCGKMFKTEITIQKHLSHACRAYKRSKEVEQKNAEMSLCDETDSSTVMEKQSLSLVVSGLSQTKCYYCIEEFSSPGYLKLHLKVCHELTKCDICGITVIGITGTRNHKIKCHEEPKLECPSCGEKFHRSKQYNAHIIKCQHQMYSCTLCGRTIPNSGKLKRHNEIYHKDKTGLRNFQIVQQKKQVQHNDLKMEITAEETMKSAHDDQGPSFKDDVSSSRSNKLDNLYEDAFMVSQVINKESRGMFVPTLNGCNAGQFVSELGQAQEVIGCIICRITFASADELMKHKLICPKNAKDHDDSQFGAEENLRLHDVKEAQTNSPIVPQDDNTDLKLEIKVEEPMLQEEEYQVPNEEPRKSVGTVLLYGDKLKDFEAEDAEDLETGIKIKEEYSTPEEDILSEHQTTTESSECHEIPMERQVVDNQFCRCTVCELTFATKYKMKYHKFVCHTEPRHKCRYCQKLYHFSKLLRRHEKSCSQLRCNKCGLQLTTRHLLNYHYITQHPHDGIPIDAEAADAEELDTGIKVKEEDPEHKDPD